MALPLTAFFRHGSRRQQAMADMLGPFFDRFSGRTVIVHCGLDVRWLTELLATGGGGRHLRFDLRHAQSRPVSPLEHVIQRLILPLALPLPLILRIDPDAILVRHLLRSGTICDPSETAWILDEIGTRFHAALRRDANGMRLERSLPPEENSFSLPAGWTT